jgi:hypothetical protein
MKLRTGLQTGDMEQETGLQTGDKWSIEQFCEQLDAA